MRSLGISLRPEGFTYALVEGTGKKHALKAAGGEDCFGRGQDASADLGRAIASSLKRVGKIDKAVLSLPSTGAVLREISLPFNERDKVEQVLKFEIESDLYHIDVEEVVCDFLELHDERATTNLLVGALPKAHVGAALKVAEQQTPRSKTMSTVFNHRSLARIATIICFSALISAAGGGSAGPNLAKHRFYTYSKTPSADYPDEICIFRKY